MSDRRRLASACGLLAPTVAVGSLLLATLLASPETFTWHGKALSDMGRPGAETFWLFNGGLIAAGLVGLPFVWRVWIDVEGALERAGTGLLAVTIVGMIGVGVFFLEHTNYYLATDLHGLAALVTFIGGPIAALVFGVGAWLAGDRRLGGGSVGFAVASMANWAIWIWYVQTVSTDPWAWFALAEFVAAALFAGWVFMLASRSWRADVQDSYPALVLTDRVG